MRFTLRSLGILVFCLATLLGGAHAQGVQHEFIEITHADLGFIAEMLKTVNPPVEWSVLPYSGRHGAMVCAKGMEEGIAELRALLARFDVPAEEPPAPPPLPDLQLSLYFVQGANGEEAVEVPELLVDAVKAVAKDNQQTAYRFLDSAVLRLQIPMVAQMDGVLPLDSHVLDKPTLFFRFKMNNVGMSPIGAKMRFRAGSVQLTAEVPYRDMRFTDSGEEKPRISWRSIGLSTAFAAPLDSITYLGKLNVEPSHQPLFLFIKVKEARQKHARKGVSSG